VETSAAGFILSWQAASRACALGLGNKIDSARFRSVPHDIGGSAPVKASRFFLSSRDRYQQPSISVLLLGGGMRLRIPLWIIVRVLKVRAMFPSIDLPPWGNAQGFRRYSDSEVVARVRSGLESGGPWLFFVPRQAGSGGVEEV